MRVVAWFNSCFRNAISAASGVSASTGFLTCLFLFKTFGAGGCCAWAELLGIDMIVVVEVTGTVVEVEALEVTTDNNTAESD